MNQEPCPKCGEVHTPERVQEAARGMVRYVATLNRLARGTFGDQFGEILLLLAGEAVRLHLEKLKPVGGVSASNLEILEEARVLVAASVEKQWAERPITPEIVKAAARMGTDHIPDVLERMRNEKGMN